jgi:FixJ family two-component response regulator
MSASGSQVRPLKAGTVSLAPVVTPAVFVVEDEVLLRHCLVSVIRGFGCLAETFASVEEFLYRPPVVGPSCLVLNVTLRGLSGLDLQTRIAMDRSDMPIILVTSTGDVLLTVRAVIAEVGEFVTAPFGEELVSAIRRSVELSVKRSSKKLILRRFETVTNHSAAESGKSWHWLSRAY